MAENIKQDPCICFVNELDYSSTSVPREHPCNERVTSAEELGTMSKNNLRGITLGIRLVWRIHSITLNFLNQNIYYVSKFIYKCFQLRQSIDTDDVVVLNT